MICVCTLHALCVCAFLCVVCDISTCICVCYRVVNLPTLVCLPQHVYELMCRMRKELNHDVYSGESEVDSLLLFDRTADIASPMVWYLVLQSRRVLVVVPSLAAPFVLCRLRN